MMQKRTQPLVSVITPVHNGAEYLAECIESVLAQTHRDWDYTIVDNGSTDGSLDIARRYAAEDGRIRVHHSERVLPVIQNHNAALRRLSPASKYCKIVFADDWIVPECLERMISVGEEHPSVGLVGAYCLEGQHVTCTGLPYSSRMVSGREICRQHLLNRLYLFGSANSVLYRADLVRGRNPFYNEANIHADTEACFDLLRSSDFGFVHQVLTFTRVRAESLTTMSGVVQTDLAGMLGVLAKYGRDYLDVEELEACLDRHLARYYRFLGKSVVFGRDRLFWDYHKRQLDAAGVGFSWTRVARGMMRELLGAALKPRGTMERLLAARRNGSADRQCSGVSELADRGGGDRTLRSVDWSR